MEKENLQDDPDPGASNCDDCRHTHKNLLSGQFWKQLPAFALIDQSTFCSTPWQLRNSVTNIKQLYSVIGNLLPESFYSDVLEGLKQSAMHMRVTPYLLSLIDWQNPIQDPIRRQFVPLGSEHLADHPMACFDSLHEREDSPVDGLVHRYADRVLFVALHTCPAYCRFCTRSYATGITKQISSHDRWHKMFDYIRLHTEIEDVVVSGGDVVYLSVENLDYIVGTLLKIPHVRRVRLATRGLSVLPMHILDTAWYKHLVDLVTFGRRLEKEVVVHTHFAHPNEITEITKQAMDRLFADGVFVRNQCVLLKGVNDSIDTIKLLIKRLGYIHIHPYYVYQHDMVVGAENLRTSLFTTLSVEKGVRGVTTGFNTPTFVVDLPGGGGKRDVHSFEYYDRDLGISVYHSPNVDSNRLYFYFDPISTLSEIGKKIWYEVSNYDILINIVLEKSGLKS